MKKKKVSSTTVLIIIFLIGLSVLLYPSISNFVNERHQSRAIATYSDALAQLTPEDYTHLWQSAEAYNRSLSGNLVQTEQQAAQYEQLLDPADLGIMGHLEIRSIGVDLPIYHGVEDTVLQVGIGHIPGSSLPTGGAGTHCVLSGHRGLPSSKLLTDLDQLQEGDVFVLYVLDRVLAYEVDQIHIVLPEETQDLMVEDGQDYCTLVTCTPYGINTHRLLVRGHRVDYTENNVLNVAADAVQIDPVLVAPVVAAPLLLILLLLLLLSSSKRRKIKDNKDIRELVKEMKNEQEPPK